MSVKLLRTSSSFSVTNSPIAGLFLKMVSQNSGTPLAGVSDLISSILAEGGCGVATSGAFYRPCTRYTYIYRFVIILGGTRALLLSRLHPSRDDISPLKKASDNARIESSLGNI